MKQFFLKPTISMQSFIFVTWGNVIYLSGLKLEGALLIAAFIVSHIFLTQPDDT